MAMANGSKNRTRWMITLAAIGILLIAGADAWHLRAAADASGGGASGSLPQDPGLYQGDTRQAYIVARDHPELLAQLDCYCGCEQHEGHKNLLDCFRTNHGACCGICVGEAVTAGQKLAQDPPVDHIPDALRARFGHHGS